MGSALVAGPCRRPLLSRLEQGRAGEGEERLTSIVGKETVGNVGPKKEGPKMTLRFLLVSKGTYSQEILRADAIKTTEAKPVTDRERLSPRGSEEKEVEE